MEVGEKLPSNIVDIVQQVIFKKTLEKIGFKAENKIYSLVFIPLPEKEIVSIFGFNITDQKEINRKEDNMENCRQDDIESKIRVLESIIGSSHDAIITKSLDGIVLSWNKGAEMIYGYSAKEVLGKPISILEPPFLVDETKELTEIVGHEEIINYFETFRLRKDGRIINVSLTLSPIYDNLENVIGVLVIARDITRSKQLEEKLQRSEEIYRIASEQTGLLVYDYDLRTDICRWSGAIEEVTGYSPLEFGALGKYVWITNIQSLNGNNSSISHLNGKECRGKYKEELKLKRKDGTYIEVENKGVSLKDSAGHSYEYIGVIKDITDWKDIVNKAKESEEKYRNIIETANEGIIIIDSKKRAIYANKKMTEILGYNLEEILGKTTLDFTDEEGKILIESSEERMRLGIEKPFELKFIHKDGSPIWVLVNTKATFDSNGNFAGSLSMFTDITERIKAEEKIKHLANVVEYSSDAIGTLSLDGIVLSWNKGAEVIYGFLAQDILGKHVSLLAPRYLKNETQSYIDLIKQTRKSFTYLTSRVKINGEVINVSITLSPIFNENGELVNVSFITRDITQHKRAEEKLRESEEKYRNIVETANEGIVITDHNNIVTYANQRMTEMLGYAVEEGIGRSAWDFIYEKDRPMVESYLKRRASGMNDSYELRFKRKDGSILWTYLNAKPLVSDAGNFIGVISMFTDITKRKEAEKALAYINIARQKEIHHRIKNNLQVISSLLDLQADKFKNKIFIKKSEVLEAFRESQFRIISMALIHEQLNKVGEVDLLNFSQYIEKLADSLFSTYRVGNEGTIIIKDIEKDIFYNMDIAVPLGIITNELISNSLKYAFPDRDKGKIWIKLHKEKKEECTIESSKMTSYILSVSDNGIGIPKDVNIENLDSLGLQLVISLIDQLDGELELKRDNGTEFIIRFAVKEVNKPAFSASQGSV